MTDLSNDVSRFTTDPQDSDSQPLLRARSHRASNHRITVAFPPSGRLNITTSSDAEHTTWTYSYGPPGLHGLLRNRYALGCALFASIGGWVFGYDQGVVANVLVMKEFVTRFPVGPWEKGMLTAALDLGALFGALLSGFLADRYSRKIAIFWACVVFMIGTTLQSLALSIFNLVLGRAIAGIGVGALSTLSPLYITEISPPELRGSLLALEQLSIVVGCVVGFWVGYATREIPSPVSFILPLALPIFPALLLAVGSFFLPPSPRLLVLQGHMEEAKECLRGLRDVTGSRQAGEGEQECTIADIELLEIQAEATLLQRTLSGSQGSMKQEHWMHREAKAWGKLFDRKYSDRTWIGVIIMFVQQWSGINALLYYGPTLVSSFGLGSEKSTLLVSGGVGIVQFLAVFPALARIDQWGRKPLLRSGSVVMGVSHLVIALVIYEYSDDWSAHGLAAWVAVTCLYTFTAAYGVSYGPVGWVLPSEVFPMSMRSKGVALSTMSNWINNFLIGLLTPAIIQASAPGTFIIFSSACFLGYLWSTYVVPETANVSLEEIDKFFRSSAGREDKELKAEIEHELGLYDLIQGLSAQS